ncbi:cytochrome b [Cellvibrio sp. NN19]|uniref:cytochrome b n=1 Tax=Cellvibrio chitinivorans TaxID=3102792 RepID=UPI002B406E3A|nr:cytochrome b [Cellvibrio sp. NN19]
MIRDSRHHFGIVSIIFHWLSAGLTLFLFGVGFYLTSYGYYSPDYLKIAHLHYALGMILFGLIVIRLLWRLSSKTPATLVDSRSAKIGIAFSKFVLYVALFAILISGYLICTAEGQSINVFDLFQVPAVVTLENEQLNLAGLSHKYIAWGLMALVIIHAGAALVHHFFKRDRTLVRMLKPGSQSQ